MAGQGANERTPARASAGATYARALRGLLPGRGTPSAHVPARTIVADTVLDPLAVSRFDTVVDAPVRDTVSPAYLHTLGFAPSLELMTDPGFGLSVLGMVHVRNAFAQLRPVRVGEKVRAEVSLSPLRAVHNGTEVDILVAGSVDGEPVFTESSTYLARGKTVPGAAAGQPAERMAMPDGLTATALWRLPRGIGPTYARVSGDYNPIHVSVLAAKAFGFRSTIAHGMYTAARALAAADPRLDAFDWTVQFASPLTLPGTAGYAQFDRDAEGFSTAVFSPSKGKPHVLTRVQKR
ncbi:MaoC/PaaZ C-terminal domain-containing protein [Brevibacterium sp. BRM-1]|uniref:MaoC/PaaZ C-terminal domain-containing protein n=1 Tax=Brevibacterium sp. BRM-1 TaxID=2999062 RepID=UPI00227DC1B3|nr:MaoC/PaaZ C-terminal domain-containing protein [Brevibacterium sp. BRM-1]WAL40798.1 MaoC/PaaZ C-terminal domain-containing protein [Brevibacterium sp. BRM-1]